MMPRSLRQLSLRTRILLIAVAASGAIVLAFAAIASLSAGIHGRVTDAQDAFIEEQRIADRLVRATARQLVAAGYMSGTNEEEIVREFRTAGDEAYEQIRSYLFRTLTGEQRLQLEAVKEQQERMEVSAVEALAFAARGRSAEAREARRETVVRGLALQRELDTFMSLRAQDLLDLRGRQEAAFRNLYRWAGALCALLLAGSLLFTAYLHRRIAAPLAGLADAARRIGDGDLSVRVPRNMDGEFATVAESFNGMAVGLALAKVDLEERNRELEAALDNVHRMREDLVQSEKLGAVGRTMAGIAHELNNPLASVLGYAELLVANLEKDGDPDTQRVRADYARPLIEEAVRARAIVHDFLQFSRRSTPQLEAVNLCRSLEVVTRMRTYSFDQAGLSLQTTCDVDAVVLAQPQRLQQVFLNVITNAYDAMAPSGTGVLRISVETDGSRVTVVCADEGPGFADPAAALEPFFTTKPVGKGTGLGLSLVHQFMQEFGGSLEIENGTERGARILLHFRATERGDAGASKAPGARSANRLSDARILVVEDEQHLRNLIGRFLKGAGADVLLASEVAEAKDILEATSVDAVISDIKMPGGASGFDLYRWIRAERSALAERFLFVTGDVADPQVAHLAQERPERLLAKPFMREDLLGRVEALFTA